MAEERIAVLEEEKQELSELLNSVYLSKQDLVNQIAAATTRIEELEDTITRMEANAEQERENALGMADVLNRRISELEAKLAELEWKPITPESLPKVGDEVGGWFGYPESDWEVRPYEDFPLINISDTYAGLKLAGWRQFRSMHVPSSPENGGGK